MAQADYVVANGTGAAVRSDLNGQLAAIVSNNSGVTEPSTPYAFQWWADTTTGLLKLRNAANNDWITLFQLDGEWTTLAIENGTATAPSFYFKDSGTDTGIFSPGADQLGIATNGVERVEFGTTEVVFNDGGADVDFRVEGDTKPNLFKVDAGADTVIIDGLTHPSADGSADQALVTNGSGTLSFASRSRLVRNAGFNSTSGTSIDFTGIPNWVKRITVMLLAVSTNGTTGVQIQLGDSGGIETTEYSTSGTAITGTNACAIATFTSGFVMLGTTAGASRSGAIIFNNISGNYWVATGNMDEQGAAQAGYTQGFKELSATLDRIRVTTINGTDAFDAGFINIIYEG